MADEESEIRRMAEIADAINAILQSDTAQSETLAPGADNKNTQNALNENAGMKMVMLGKSTSLPLGWTRIRMANTM